MICVIYCDLVVLVVVGGFCEDFYFCFGGVCFELLLLCECSDWLVLIWCIFDEEIVYCGVCIEFGEVVLECLFGYCWLGNVC